MEEKEFLKLITKTSAKNIIYMYCNNKIKLTSKQLDRVIKLKNGVIK